MNSLDFRNPQDIEKAIQAVRRITTKNWKIMEVCGGQTHSILKYGLDQLLPIEFLHGPGCPVCVTPAEILDEAIALAQQSHIIFCTFADMLRVPGHQSDLLSAKAKGADVRSLYSPVDAIKIAEDNPQKEVVFFAVGFETTAPANAMALYHAEKKGLKNFSLLISQVLVPPAIEALLADPAHQIDGFLAAGHVCTITGYSAYEAIASRHKIPIVVTGFEPLDIVQGIFLCVQQLEQSQHHVENQYTRSVNREGNSMALAMVQRFFTVCDMHWRGLGEIPHSGLRLRTEYKHFDAKEKFPVSPPSTYVCNTCLSGEILRGLRKPIDCPEYATNCTPEHPLGATMVSNEGACAAYYLYKELP